MVTTERKFLELAWSLACGAEEQSQQRGDRGHWMRLECRDSLGQGQDYADELDEVPIDGNLGGQAGV